jgi:hypothetical protein
MLQLVDEGLARKTQGGEDMNGPGKVVELIARAERQGLLRRGRED